MSTQEWAGLILTLLSIGAILIGALSKYIDLKNKPILEAIEDVRKETKTNGGSSMRDEIKAIKTQQVIDSEVRKENTDKINHLYDLFVDYVSKNSK